MIKRAERREAMEYIKKFARVEWSLSAGKIFVRARFKCGCVCVASGATRDLAADSLIVFLAEEESRLAQGSGCA